MVEVKFYDTVNDELLKFAVIILKVLITSWQHFSIMRSDIMT